MPTSPFRRVRTVPLVEACWHAPPAPKRRYGLISSNGSATRRRTRSRRFRMPSGNTGRRSALKKTSSRGWREQRIAGINSAVLEFKGVLNLRHWLAHGRYWKPKLGRVAGYDAVNVFPTFVRNCCKQQGLRHETLRRHGRYSASRFSACELLVAVRKRLLEPFAALLVVWRHDDLLCHRSRVSPASVRHCHYSYRACWS